MILPHMDQCSRMQTYNFLGFMSHGSNSQELFLSHQLISVSLHGSSFHLAIVYVPNSVEHFLLLPKRKIHPYIIIYFGEFHMNSLRMLLHKRTNILHLLLHSATNCSKIFTKFLFKTCIFLFLLILRGGIFYDVFPYFLGLLSNIL